MLKEKYNLSEADIDAAQVREVHSVKISKDTQQPIWLTNLISVIAKAFNCHGIYTHGCWQFTKFLGMGNKPELAAYVYDSLRRQVEKDRAAYAKTLYRYKNKANKTKALNLYCLAWVEEVETKIADFACAYLSKEAAAIRAYKNQNFTVLGADTRTLNFNGLSNAGLAHAALTGKSDGKKANVFRPIASGKPPASTKALPRKSIQAEQTSLF